MKISAHILPRRVILALILLMAWGLRLWGLAWGTDQAGAVHPDEWTWQVIDSLSLNNPTYQGIWTQAFFSLAALVRGAVSSLAGWLGVWLGEVRTSTELVLPARLAGRLTVALLGGGQVWLAYLVGRRYFDSVATGLLAAAALAVSPLLVSQGHYLSLDTPLGLAVMFCLWAAWQMVQSPGGRSQALAGLALGLTLTTKASGVLVLPVFAGAFVLAQRREDPGPWTSALLWPAAFVGGLALGLLLGYPGFLVRLPEVGDVLSASFSWPLASPGPWWARLAERWRGVWGVLGGAVGLELMALWLVSAGLMIWRRLWQRLLLLVFPALYLLASLTVLRGPVEGQMAVWLPLAWLAACWPLVVACRRLPGRWWPVAGVGVLGVLLCLWPLWRSLGVSYLFWQQDTMASARFWLESNLPAGAALKAGPRIPLEIFPGAQSWKPADGELPPGYLVVSSLGPEGDPCAARPAQDASGGQRQLIKRFDLRGGWGGRPGSPCFPRWVSPRVDVYAPPPPRQVGQPLALWRPAVGQSRGYAVVYADDPAYGRSENMLWLQGPGLAQRVLRAGRPLGELGLELDNQGQDLALAEVSQGPFNRKLLTIYPGQALELPLGPKAWPPMAQGLYPVRVVLRRGGGLVGRLDWDPLLLGRRALEAGLFPKAHALLQRAVQEQGPGFDALALLAGAQARLGLYEDASRALGQLSERQGEPARTYLALAAPNFAGGEKVWDARFDELTGYHSALLRQATSLSYQVSGPLCLSEGQEVPLSGEGYHGSYLRRPGRPGGHLKLWLDAPFPYGQFRVDLGLSHKGPASGGSLALAEVWSHGPGGSRLLASRPVTTADLPGGQGVVGLPAPLAHAGAKLEIRLNFQGAAELRLQQVVVGVDLPAHMRHVLRWYHEAWGLVSLKAGRFAAAVAAFESLLELDPGFSEAYLPLAQALIDSGRLDQARQRVLQAEELFFSQPERLARVRDLYQILRRPQDVARVEKRLGDLRPSLKREARFANGLALLGYDLANADFRRGGQVDLSYYWQAWARPPMDYFIFVHLKGPDQILTYDHLLDHGRRPMPDLALGGVVREDYRITIPLDAPPGRYRLILGMWDPRFTGQRVGVAEGEGQGGDEVTLTTVDIR